jgi:hypothetical protein
VKEYESIEKKVDKLLKEKDEEKENKKNQNIKTCEEYKSERDKISKHLMKFKEEYGIN